ncbi:MAG: nucleoside recognition protein [Bacteroidia bacterium]|nr:nucleoside recognition protein [Bacteroidia bacterium]
MGKVTVLITFAMMLLKYFDILPWISDFISPVFKYFGLPGSAALAYISGYFVNCYSAIAVISVLDLDWRATTIIATMVLCSHSMVLETAVLKKTGASAARMVTVRTVIAIALGLILNAILPGTPASAVDAAAQKWTLPFGATLWQWFLSTLKLLALMTAIIFALNILQRLFTEFGIMDVIARIFKPLMYVLGLPANVTFLWLVANIVGLGYGAAVMLDEVSLGRLSEREVKLLDSHICVSHSNVEDLSLMTALGGVWWVMLLIRMAAAVLLVWEQRLEFYIKDRLNV